MRLKALLGAAAGALAMAAMAAPAQAREWYGRVDVGTTVNQEVDIGGNTIELGDGQVTSVGVGTTLDSLPMRIEGSISHSQADILGLIDVDDTSVDATAYYDFNRGGRWQPYVSGSVGYGSSEINLPGNAIDGQGFNWGVGVGTGYAVNEHITLDGSLRYGESDRDFGSGFDADRTGATALIGVRLS
jgi:opacity protein-like surface antigen